MKSSNLLPTASQFLLHYDPALSGTLEGYEIRKRVVEAMKAYAKFNQLKPTTK